MRLFPPNAMQLLDAGQPRGCDALGGAPGGSAM
jgi:hypothetical protein